MAIEKPPKGGNTVTIAAGKPWARQVDAEFLRLAEGSVDEKGIRRTYFSKDSDQAVNNAKMQQYKRMGYTVEDQGYQLEMTIKESDFIENVRKPSEEAGMRRVTQSKTLDANELREGYTSTMEAMPSLRVEDILGEEED